jgi:hypothetical protein
MRQVCKSANTSDILIIAAGEIISVPLATERRMKDGEGRRWWVEQK